MPYEIVKLRDGYHVRNQQTGEIKNKKPYPDAKAALPYMRALYAADRGVLKGPVK